MRCPACIRLTKSPLKKHVQAGKGAIKPKEKTMFELAIDCSVDLDGATEGAGRRRNEKCFDYLIVVESACEERFVEVHPASSSSEVDTVIKKKRDCAAVLSRLGISNANATWHWLVFGQGTVSFNAGDRYGKILGLAGIAQPRRKMTD